MNALMDAVRAGRAAEVAGLLDGMTDAERRIHFPELKALRAELRPERWDAQARRALPALHMAGAACQTGAAAVANWLAAADFRWSQASPTLLIDILADRDLAWLADVTHRLAQRPVSARVPFALMAGLVRLSACAAPTTEAYVQGWLMHIGSAWTRSDSIVDRLRQEPHLTELVAALFEIDDIGSVLGWVADDGPNTWTGSLARLTEEGVLERKSMVDGCVARLLRGGRPADHRVFLRLLKALALTRDEERERMADWTALASDAASPVATHAQSVLAGLALDGELPPRRLAEMSDGVLFRPEKKLVRAQLVLLGKVLARDASAADVLLPAAAQGLGHADSEVQERAVKLVERHAVKIGDPGVREELAAAAGQLTPVLRGRVAGALGVEPVTAQPGAYEELLPPVPVPTRLAPAPESAGELAEEVGALLASGDEVAEFERALDGLVRHGYRNRDELLEALEPVVARRWWGGRDPQHVFHADDPFSGYRRDVLGGPDGLDLLLATLRGNVLTATLHAAVQTTPQEQGCIHSPLFRAFTARLWEAAFRIRTEPVPFLLSTPTWTTGLLDPDELVNRLDTYRELGARVGPADFATALLRVGRDDRAAAGAAAGRAASLGTPEGTQLARWLTADGPALPPVRRRTAGPRVLLECGELDELQRDLPAGFHPLGRPVTVYSERWRCYHWDADLRPHWLALLPERRELVAVRLLRDLSATAVDGARGTAAILPRLAESGGQAGEAVHLSVAYALGARHPEDRLAAVEALLVLAARGQLDAARLGADLGELVQRGAVKPARLAESVRTAAATGANATIWGMLRHTLPALLGGLSGDRSAKPAPGLADLLAVAAECAERSEARGQVPYLAQTAERGGSSRLVSEARRLRTALGEEVAA
ncbi:DUF6493 family protein [Streptomyces sp. NPDC050803]|uniref:DUF7824 domain-containing protein n=1 Tax=unclassified Streptomyces TaxID=2593676 RepID=UPI0034230455